MQAKYDQIAKQYDAMNVGKDGQLTVLNLAYLALIERVGTIKGKILLDLACGTGTLTLHWAKDAARVIGVDYSSEMLAQAQAKAESERVEWLEDDAQSLSKIADNSCDIVTSCFALMDIPDLQALIQSVRRVLKIKGRFVFVITHPCFQSPHAEMIHHDTQFKGRQIREYTQEGHWKSSYASGIRGQVGAHHRTVSTYINSLITHGFMIQHVAEPTPDSALPDNPYSEMMYRIPSIMLIDAQLIAKDD